MESLSTTRLSEAKELASLLKDLSIAHSQFGDFSIVGQPIKAVVDRLNQLLK